MILTVNLTLPGVLGVSEEGNSGGLTLRLVCGVAGAELVLVGGGGGGRFGEQWDLSLVFWDRAGALIDGSDTLLVNKWSCSLAAGCWGTALWSEEEEDRLSVLRAKEEAGEEVWDEGKAKEQQERDNAEKI